jgi:hypothetical protein
MPAFQDQNMANGRQHHGHSRLHTTNTAYQTSSRQPDTTSPVHARSRTSQQAPDPPTCAVHVAALAKLLGNSTAARLWNAATRAVSWASVQPAGEPAKFGPAAAAAVTIERSAFPARPPLTMPPGLRMC